MKVWTDEHFIKVHDPPADGYNRIVFKNMSEERPKGFLSYSSIGSVEVGNKTERKTSECLMRVGNQNAAALPGP